MTPTSGSTPFVSAPWRPALGEAFADRDPANAAAYRANADALVRGAEGPRRGLRTSLSRCETTDLVTGHAAFGYLAERYGLSQEGIAGISPDAEPDAATLRALTEQVRSKRATITPRPSSPRPRRDHRPRDGRRVAVLDPLEGLTDASAGGDYLEVMRTNLADPARGAAVHLSDPAPRAPARRRPSATPTGTVVTGSTSSSTG